MYSCKKTFEIPTNFPPRAKPFKISRGLRTPPETKNLTCSCHAIRAVTTVGKPKSSKYETSLALRAFSIWAKFVPPEPATSKYSMPFTFKR